MQSVSIVIPTYNRWEMVCEAIDSALAQTYDHCELVVIDDGSTDGTTETLQEKFGSQIVLLKSDHVGVSSARNLGIKQATGTYIKFLDSDDKLTPDAIERQIQDMQTLGETDIAVGLSTELGKPSYCGTNHNLVDPGFEGYLSEDLVIGKSMAAWLPLFPRSILVKIGGFNPEFTVSEDHEMCVRILAEGFRFYQFSSVCYQVRNHEGGRLSRTLDAESFHSCYRAMLSIRTLVESGAVRGDLKTNKDAIALRAWSFGRRAARRSLKKEADYCFELAKDLGLTSTGNRNRLVVAAGRLVGSYRAERILELSKKVLAR